MTEKPDLFYLRAPSLDIVSPTPLSRAGKGEIFDLPLYAPYEVEVTHPLDPKRGRLSIKPRNFKLGTPIPVGTKIHAVFEEGEEAYRVIYCDKHGYITLEGPYGDGLISEES